MLQRVQDVKSRNDQSEMFNRLRPVCVKLTRERTVANVKELQKALYELRAHSYQELGEYLLFPLRLILRQEIKSENLVLHTLECMTCILSKTTVLSWNLFSDVFVQLFMLTGSPKEGSKVSQSSEELKTSVLKCVKTLINNVSESILQQIFQIYFCPSLGHAVYYLLHLAENEKSKSLKVNALDVIGSIILLAQKGDAQLQKLAGDRFAAFLPGISLSLGRVINENPNQLVIVSALNLWSLAISTVISDHQLKVKLEDKSRPSLSQSGKDSKLPHLPEINRNKAWVSDTASKIEILVRKIVTLVTHSHWRVRLALIQWAEVLLFECTWSLAVCISPLLEVAITLSVDSYAEVAELSTKVLLKFSEYYISEDARSLLDIVEEDLHVLSTRLPRIIKSGDDSQKLVVLNLLAGYLHLLGSSINHLLYSFPHQSRLISALLQLSELDTTDVHLLEEGCPLEELGNNLFPKVHWPRKYFKHFRNDKICKSLILVCHLLGFYGDTSLLVDCLVEKIQESSVYKKQAIFMLNEIILGIKYNIFENDQRFVKMHKVEHERSHELTELIRNLLEEYLSSECWDVITTNAATISEIDCDYFPKQQPSLTFEKLNSNILQNCLLLEGIAKFAQVLGPDFRTFLITTLCPLLEKAGSQCSIVAHTANIAVHLIAASCGYCSVTFMITQNADYLVNSLTAKLRQYTHNHDASAVLKVIFQQCDASVLNLIQDPVTEALSLLDQHHTKNPLPLLKILHSLVLAVQKEENCITSIQQKEVIEVTKAYKKSDEKHLSAPEKIREFYLEYHNLKHVSDFNRYDESDAEIAYKESPPDEENDYYDDNNYNDENNRKELPLHAEIVLEVLKRCIHLQSHHDHWIRLCVLDIIALGVTALKNHQDSLLPVVHQLWSPFLQRFSDEQIVTVKAFETLLVLAEASGDFLRKRTLKDVWPKLVEFLQEQSRVSLGKDSASCYRFTVNYKHQLALLTGLGPLAQKLEVQDTEVELLAAACRPYLSCNQPLPLQEMAVKTIEHLMFIDSCVIWLYLNTTYSPLQELLPPQLSVLQPVKFENPFGIEYQKNVKDLLKKLDAHSS